MRLVEIRFSQGLASALEVYQQRQQASAIEALIPPIEARLAIARHQVAVLAGIPPGAATDVVGGDLPELPPLPAAGLPADLLRRWPDVAAAGARFHAADGRVAAAIANRLPALRPSGAGGTQTPDFAALMAEWFGNVVGGLTAPILDGGRRRIEVERVRAAREKAGHAWRHAMQALREVEDELEMERRQAELVERLRRQREAAARTLDQARASYVNGLIDYLPVLTALDRMQQIDQALVSGRRQLLLYRVQLHRAFGGGWMAELKLPAPA